MEVKIFAVIPKRGDNERDASSLTLKDKDVGIWVPERGFVKNMNSDKPSYYKVQIATAQILFTHVAKTGERLLVKEPGFNVSESTIISLLSAIEEENSHNIQKFWMIILRDNRGY